MPKNPSEKSLKEILKAQKKLNSAIDKIVAAHSKAKPKYDKIYDLTGAAQTHADLLGDALEDHNSNTDTAPAMD